MRKMEFPEKYMGMDAYSPIAMGVYLVVALMSFFLFEVLFNTVLLSSLFSEIPFSETPFSEIVAATLLFVCCMYMTGAFDPYSRNHLLQAITRILLGLMLVCVLIFLFSILKPQANLQLDQVSMIFFTSYSSYIQLAGLALVLKLVEFCISSEAGIMKKLPLRLHANLHNKKEAIVLIGSEHQYQSFMQRKDQFTACDDILGKTAPSFISIPANNKEDIKVSLENLDLSHELKNIILLQGLNLDAKRCTEMPVDCLLELKLEGVAITSEEHLLTHNI